MLQCPAAVDFWQAHGWLFLIGVTLFPRLTMLSFVSVPFGLLVWAVGRAGQPCRRQSARNTDSSVTRAMHLSRLGLLRLATLGRQ
jgi:hypothetical protein